MGKVRIEHRVQAADAAAVDPVAIPADFGENPSI
jgi:hypothetical protein